MRDWLRSHCKGMFVAFAQGSLVAKGSSFDSVIAEVEGNCPTGEVYVEVVDDEAFDEPAPIEMTGLQDVQEAAEGSQ